MFRNLLNFEVMLMRVPAVLIALTFHEFAHAYTAYKLGDYTAKLNGRLTLNPIKHLDPIGTLFLVIFGFGWAKPVPVSTLYFKKPRRDMAIVAITGPLSNFIMAIIGSVLFALSAAFFGGTIITTIMWYFMAVNIGLGIFNLIPFPPLDGSRVLMYFLPSKVYMKVAEFEQYSFIILLLLVWLGAFDFLMNKAVLPLVGLLGNFSAVIYSVIK